MKTAIILGSRSDIAQAITPMLAADGYEVHGWHRGQRVEWPQWDLVIIAIGAVAPVGLWHDVNVVHWYNSIYNNLICPFEKLRSLWTKRKPDATVIWFAGSNPNAIMAGYSAYNAGKMAVLKLVEQLDAESPDCKFVALGPGTTDTKIHNATKEAAWPNEKLDKTMRERSFTLMEDIYLAITWCVQQPKAIVGGRNVCVSDLKRATTNLAAKLQNESTMFKLRRDEGRSLLCQ